MSFLKCGNNIVKKKKMSIKEVNPIISIIVPTYNRGNIIHRSIESIRKQTFQNWECLIVDDHSSDNSPEIVRKLIENDSRFSYMFNNRLKGAPGARNTGIIAARGKYILLFDSDNVMHYDFLNKVYLQLTKDKVDVCSSFSSIIDENTCKKIGTFNWQGYGDVHDAILGEKSYFDNSSTLIKKQKLIEIGLLDENCPSFQEWDTHIRLSKISTYSTYKEELIDYYRGGSDAISKSLYRSVLGRMYILKKHKSDFIKNNCWAYIRDYLDVYRKIIKLRKSSCSNKTETLLDNFKDDTGFVTYYLVIILHFLTLNK